MHIGVIGCGVMGSAFARHFAIQHTVYVFDRNPKKAETLAKEIGGLACKSLKEAIQGKEAVLLAIKPKDLVSFGTTASDFFSKNQLFFSVLAGTSLEALKKTLPVPIILRMMPNLALTCGQGVIGLSLDDSLTEEIKQETKSLLTGLGLLAWVPENKMDALTSLCSSGMAFVYVIIEAMIEAGVSMGLNAKESEKFAIQMIEGSTALLKASGKHPAAIKWEIASPAGTTIAGLNAMEEKGVRAGVINAFQATFAKAKSL